MFDNEHDSIKITARPHDVAEGLREFRDTRREDRLRHQLYGQSKTMLEGNPDTLPSTREELAEEIADRFSTSPNLAQVALDSLIADGILLVAPDGSVHA
ncbi:hypothetical protein LRY29_01155 [Candidatus Saccharibacteria bacterium]|nr:hypothetical protein [Candidatus Saccharibacteria bacterium]